MATTASSTSTTNFADQIPATVYDAVCIGFYDMGVHFSPTYGKSSPKCRLAFELIGHTVPDKDGVEIPAVVGSEFTLSLSDKATLYGFIKAWRGVDFTADELRKFEVTSMVGKACMLNVIHQKSEDGTKTYVNIGAVMPLKKGATVPMPINDLVVLDLDNFDGNVFSKLPEFIQNKIKQSETWKTMFDAFGNTIVAPVVPVAPVAPVAAKLAQAKAALSPTQQATVKKVAPSDAFAVINGFTNAEQLHEWAKDSGYRDTKFAEAVKQRKVDIAAEIAAEINNDLPF